MLFAAILTLWLGTSLWYWLLVWSGLSITRPLSVGDVLGATIWLLILVAIASVFHFLGQLFKLRIVIAPDLLTPLTKENVTLELRPSTSDQPGELIFARYSSTCAVCGAGVLLFDGDKGLPRPYRGPLSPVVARACLQLRSAQHRLSATQQPCLRGLCMAGD